MRHLWAADMNPWPLAWATAWLVALASGWLVARAAAWEARWPRWHVRLLWCPVAVSLAGLTVAPGDLHWGPWRFDRLGWLISLYVALLGVVIQSFAARYLQGDKAYGRYLAGLTWVTGVAAATWMSDHLALLAAGWGVMNAGLAGLLALKWEWRPVRAVVALLARHLLLGAGAVALAAWWLARSSGTWQLSAALAQGLPLSPAARAGMAGLLVLAALVQAGSWPFQRWLLESAVAPTPVSAVMHAGLVNAGGLLLTRLAPLMEAAGTSPRLALLVLAGLSALLGSGIMWVYPDYKRQLVASTMAQMGLLLTQCALGAYEAAVVHLILHGWFKATLFLQAGSVVPRGPRLASPSVAPSRAARPLGLALAGLLGVGYWLVAPGEPVRALSALFLAGGVLLAWQQLWAVREGAWLGTTAVALAVLASEGVRSALAGLALGALPAVHEPPPGLAPLALAIFALSALAAGLVVARPHARSSAWLYLRLVHLGAARPVAVEAHPFYLQQYVKEASLR